MVQTNTAVILYRHALLGRGIARHLGEHSGCQPVVADASDPEAVIAALETRPRIVVFEATPELRELDLAALAPQAELVDVTHAVANGPEAPECRVGLEALSGMMRAALTSP